MPERRLWYRPNPAHKLETTEAGPPAWFPHKTACPPRMSAAERETLVQASVPRGDDPLDPVRYAVARDGGGEIRWYKTALTLEHPDGRIEIHGYPFLPGSPKIPSRVLRRMRESGIISESEYRKAVRA